MKHLTREQRYAISVMLQNKIKQKEIAESIGVHKSTISRELKRNCDQRNNSYRYDLAQKKCKDRHTNKPKYKSFSDEVKTLVDSCLKNDLSPEQIVGRANLEGKKIVSHERIYQYIWTDKKTGGNLFSHLRRNGRKYRKRGAAKDTRGIIKDRVDISQRPAIVDKKTRIGDMEIDTIIGQNHKGAILTINDRVSGFVFIEKLNGKDAMELANKAIETLSPFKEFIHTITGDNGKEFAEHKKISSDLELNFYFAKPYHSWERGANENTNGLIRQYIPKKTDFDTVDKEYIKQVQNKLNNRPRKKLGYLSPIEFLSLNLSNTKVAFIT